MTITTILALAVSTVTAPGWVLSARHARRLRRRLLTDRLTGLANRDALEAFATARRRKNAVGVVLFDLDYFKAINDLWGHDAGNTVLRHVARQLTVHCGQHGSALPVRLHGDEFVVLLTDLPLGATGVRLAQARAHELAVAIGVPVRYGVDQLAVTGSVGVAVAPAAQADLSALLRAADQRMYAAKRAHGGDRAARQSERWSA